MMPHGWRTCAPELFGHQPAPSSEVWPEPTLSLVGATIATELGAPEPGTGLRSTALILCTLDLKYG